MRASRLALAAAATAALAGGVARRRRRSAPADAAAPPPVPGRQRTVLTEDGVELHVEEHGAQAEPTATVLLLHGYVQSSRLWAGQVRDLVEARPDLRVVVHDSRGHGRSGPTSRTAATLEQLARDLDRVVQAVAPVGPVVLVGHSMGGMQVMALAEQRPELFGSRITGVALLGTSSGGLADVTWGLPAPVARVVRRAVPVVNEQLVRAEARGRSRRVSPLEARLVFGRGADPALVREVLQVQAACRADTMAAFLSTFSTHDRLAALAALAEVPALVVVGNDDLLCPVAHSRTLAGALPRAELAVYPGVGHMVHLERRPEVSRQLVRLVDRALAATPVRV